MNLEILQPCVDEPNLELVLCKLTFFSGCCPIVELDVKHVVVFNRNLLSSVYHPLSELFKPALNTVFFDKWLLSEINTEVYDCLLTQRLAQIEVVLKYDISNNVGVIV